jgi:Elongation factor P (EF-P) KOW-like domain
MGACPACTARRRHLPCPDVHSCNSCTLVQCRVFQVQAGHSAAFIARLQVTRRRALQVLAAGTVSTNDFKNGLTVEIDGQPFRVMGAQLYRSNLC